MRQLGSGLAVGNTMLSFVVDVINFELSMFNSIAAYRIKSSQGPTPS